MSVEILRHINRSGITMSDQPTVPGEIPSPSIQAAATGPAEKFPKDKDQTAKINLIIICISRVVEFHLKIPIITVLN